MVIQHAQNSTGARRVSFFRPVARGRRWHVATVLDDGTFYYGLACPETLGWSRVSFEQRRPDPLRLAGSAAGDWPVPSRSRIAFLSRRAGAGRWSRGGG